MKRRTLKCLTLAVTLAVTGCIPGLETIFGPRPGISHVTPSSAPTQAPTQAPTPAPTQAPPGGNPTPGATLPPEIIKFGSLSEIALGFLVSNNAAGLSGTVSGPTTLVSNNAAGLVSNNAAGLVSNNAAGLVSNNAAGYRIAAVEEIRVADGFVYLTTPDERLYVDDRRKLFGALTDRNGNFDMPAPAARDLIVNVLLSGNRRLTAIASTEPGSKPQIKVNLATTLVTEFLRAKAREFGFTLADVFARPEALALLREIEELTETLVKKDGVLAGFKPSDLTINNIPLLRHRYVVAFGTGSDPTLSDKWVALLRAMKNDSTSPDVVYRPLAVTTVDTGDMIPPGDQVLSVGVAPAGAPNAGKIYVSHLSPNVTEILELAPGGGSPRSLIKKLRLGADAYRLPGTLEVRPDGGVVLMDTLNQWVALADPSPTAPDPLPDSAYFGFDDFGLWKNPKLLVDVFCGTVNGPCDENASTGASADDVAFDDQGNMFLADLNQHVVWKAADVFNRDPSDPLEEFAGKRNEVNQEMSYSDRASLRFNQPGKVTFHNHGGNRYLYVASNGDHVIVRINLGDNTVKRVVGLLPAAQFPKARGDKKGPRKAGCYQAEEEGKDATKANLRFPQKMLFDKSGRMLIADGDNRLIRIATVYDAEPKIWTIAGRPPQTNSNCETVGLPPPFSDADGEARLVSLGEVSGMALDPDGNLILSDVRSHRVRKLWTSFLK